MAPYFGVLLPQGTGSGGGRDPGPSGESGQGSRLGNVEWKGERKARRPRRGYDVCVCGSLRGGERQQRSGLEAAAEVAGPGGATAARKPRRPATEGRRLRGHSLRYLPAGMEDKEAVGTQPAQAPRCQQRRSPNSPSHCSQNRCVDLFGISVSAPAHTAPVRPLGMGGESRRRWQRRGGVGGAQGRRGVGGGAGGGRIQCVSFCSSRPASHWLHSGFSATTNRRLVLVSLCAWNSLEGRSEGGALEVRSTLEPPPRPQPPQTTPL